MTFHRGETPEHPDQGYVLRQAEHLADQGWFAWLRERKEIKAERNHMPLVWFSHP